MKPYRVLAVSLAACLALAAQSMAATVTTTDSSRIAAQYSDWAGSRSNIDAIVAGLRSGGSITLVTNDRDRNVSIAGFTPSAPMSYSSIQASLANAERSLARLGIRHPNAEQIQAALIGGDVTLPSGSAATLRGTVAAQGAPNQVAVR